MNDLHNLKYEEVLKTHIAVFGRDLARVGMLNESKFDLALDYPYFLISNEGTRWMIEFYLKNLWADRRLINVGKLLDQLNEEYLLYDEWIELKKELRKEKRDQKIHR